MAETAMDAVVAVDSQGHVIFWNQSAKKMFGYASDEILWQRVSLIIPLKFHQDHESSVNRVFATGKSNLAGKILRYDGLKKDGAEFPLELSLGSWKTPEGVFRPPSEIFPGK